MKSSVSQALENSTNLRTAGLRFSKEFSVTLHYWVFLCLPNTLVIYILGNPKLHNSCRQIWFVATSSSPTFTQISKTNQTSPAPHAAPRQPLQSSSFRQTTTVLSCAKNSLFLTF